MGVLLAIFLSLGADKVGRRPLVLNFIALDEPKQFGMFFLAATDYYNGVCNYERYYCWSYERRLVHPMPDVRENVPSYRVRLSYDD